MFAVVKHKRVNEHQTITFSKEDMLGGQKKLPKQNSFSNREDNKKDDKKYNEKSDQSIPLMQSVQEKSIALREVDGDNNENDDRQNESWLEIGKEQQPISPEPPKNPYNIEIQDNADNRQFSTRKATVAENDAMSKIIDAVKIISKEKQKHPRISFVDFGGQSMYYAFHQIFLSPKTFYVLVLDMSKSPDETVYETEDKCGSRFSTWKYKGNVCLIKLFVVNIKRSGMSWPYLTIYISFDEQRFIKTSRNIQWIYKISGKKYHILSFRQI